MSVKAANLATLTEGQVYQGGEAVTLAGPGDRFKFRTQAPFGTEIILAVASPVQFSDEENLTFAEVDLRKSLSRGTRGLTVEVEEAAGGLHGEAVTASAGPGSRRVKDHGEPHTLPVASFITAASPSSERFSSPARRPSCMTRARSAMPSSSSISLETKRMAMPWPASSSMRA